MKRYAVKEIPEMMPVERQTKFRIFQNDRIRLIKKGAVMHVEQAVQRAKEDRKK